MLPSLLNSFSTNQTNQYFFSLLPRTAKRARGRNVTEPIFCTRKKHGRNGLSWEKNGKNKPFGNRGEYGFRFPKVFVMETYRFSEKQIILYVFTLNFPGEWYTSENHTFVGQMKTYRFSKIIHYVSTISFPKE